MDSYYLPLTEYSSKHKVSISTLRRRIKTNDIQFRFDQGKYFILDQTTESVSPRPSLKDANHKLQSPSLAMPSHKKEEHFVVKSEKDFLTSAPVKNDEPILTAANKLLTELKKAYTQILQEKEEQILHLKEEVTDLKTLVRVLESENQRLNYRN